MQTFVQDLQVVPEVQGVLFSTLTPGPVTASVTLQNRGTNTMNYIFQQSNDGGATWQDMDVLGTAYNNTLTAAQVRSFVLTSASSLVRLVGYASGGTTLDFSLARFFNRASGGSAPLLTC